ncbi:MAG: RNA methyltransferase [Pirellulaceae bacterium]|nr:RNA methyltransferase [Pirellulaceae bacterium]
MPRIPVDNLTDPRLAPYRELSQRNLTRLSGLFVAEGDKVVDRLIASRYPVASVLAEAPHAERVVPHLPDETPIYVASRELLEATIGFNFHRGILACGRRLPSPTVAEITRGTTDHSTIVVCPDVQDPTNLGGIIRAAAAFDCTAVVLGGKCADPLSRRVLRVSMGAALHLPVCESSDLPADLASLSAEDYELVATVLDPAAEPLATSNRPPKLALLLGSEGHGLGPEWLRLAHRRVTIPMRPGIDSLNVAAAAAVFLHHYRYPDRA